VSERTCFYTENRVSSLVTTEKGGCVDWLPIVKILLREARPFLPAHVLAVIRYRTIVALFHSSSTKPCLLPEAKFFTALLTPSTFTVPFWVFLHGLHLVTLPLTHPSRSRPSSPASQAAHSQDSPLHSAPPAPPQTSSNAPS